MNKNIITLDLMLPDLKDFSEEEQKVTIQNFFTQVQGVLIGAIVCIPAHHDFKLKLNNQTIVEQIQLPEVLINKLVSNKNLISIVDVVSGNGKIFK
jgi:hypothetical protein